MDGPSLADRTKFENHCAEWQYGSKGAKAATRIQAAVRGRTVRGYPRARKRDTSTYAYLPGFAPPSPARVAMTTALAGSPDSVNAHPACRSHGPTTVACRSAIRLQALARGMLVKCAASHKRARRVTVLSLVHTRAIAILHTELTQSANTLLRFARRRCLKSQHRKDDQCTIKEKRLIRQLTTAMRGESERVQDQLAMEMHAEQAAQHTEEATGAWGYIPCYLVKHADGVEVHTPTCVKTGCNMRRHSLLCSKHPNKEKLFCSPECKDEVCKATGLRVQELRWVHDQ
jgi:hypothetical protein